MNGYGPGAVGNIAPTLRIAGPPSILEFAKNANGNVSPQRWIIGSKTLLNNPRGVAVSKRTGEIFVADDLGVLVFAATARGNISPIRIVRSDEGAVGGVALRE